MPTERPAQRLSDILANIERIRRHVQGMDDAAFKANDMAVDAVERCYERIAEAARKLGGQYDAAYPDLQLESLRQFGSILRHDYDGIEPRRLWAYTKERLDSLEAMARTELAKLEK